MKPHIGFLIMNMDNGGGTERVTSIIANGLAKNDYCVSIISCNNGTASHFSLLDNVKTYSLCGEKYHNSIKRKINTYRRLKKVVKELNIDIMVAVDIALYIYLAPLQLQKKCKSIAWEHFNYYISRNTLTRISRYLATQLADCIIVLGKKDLANYNSNYRKIKRIEYIYNPNAVSINCDSDMNNKRIISIGRLEYQKGYDLLIKVWNSIEKEFPEWELVIFGKGSMERDLQNEIDNLNLKNIRLAGYANDVENELSKSSIFVFSSRFEGFGLVLIEAQAKGLPCISFDCKEGPSEIIDNNVNGYLIENGNVDEMSAKLKELMRNEELRRFFSSNSRKDLCRFDEHTVIEKWNELLLSI